MDQLWEILPLKGLGPLRFGMQRDDALAAAAVFGPVTFVHPPQGGFDQTLAVLIPSMGEQAARELLTQMQADGVDMRPRDHVTIGDALRLGFVGDTLESLMGYSLAASPQLHVGGHPLLTGDAIPALRLLQQFNGAPPLVEGPDCWFATIRVTAWNCIKRSRKGVVRPVNPRTDAGEQQTIGWSADPRDPLQDLSKHIAVDVMDLSAQAR